MSKILHLIVNYKNDQETKEFVSNLCFLSDSEQVKKVIINNSAAVGGDEVFADLQASRPHIAVLKCPDNPGYFTAAERACELFPPGDYLYVILSNSDVKILDKDFYKKIMCYELKPDVGAIAPSIRSDLTQNESNPLYAQRPSLHKINRLERVYSYFLLAWVYHVASWVKNRFFNRRVVPTETQEIYALHGSFIILSKYFFLKGGSFKYPVKLYGEEIFLAEKLRQLKLKTLYEPTLSLYHREKGTEASWIARYAISHTTFLYKQQSLRYIKSLFNSGS